jgi:coenzyme PQQ precursor peptide PqqA
VPSDAKKGQDSIETCSVYGNEARSFKSRAEREAVADMTWKTPVITEICVGMEVTSYLSAEI